MDLIATGKALCQGSCGLVDVADLIPDANDPPGRCPSCGGQTCQCSFCGETAQAKHGENQPTSVIPAASPAKPTGRSGKAGTQT
jgi:hypothetical protein